MNNIKIKVNNHRAVLTFKQPSKVKFSMLKWEIIEKNIDEIILTMENEQAYFPNQIEGK